MAWEDTPQPTSSTFTEVVTVTVAIFDPVTGVEETVFNDSTDSLPSQYSELLYDDLTYDDPGITYDYKLDGKTAVTVSNWVNGIESDATWVSE